ncbi:MAG: AsmA family protein, partial [Desulfobacterales bacterium]
TAQVADRDGSIDIEGFEIKAGNPETPAVQLEGRIDDIQDRAKTRIQANFDVASRPWLETYGLSGIAEDPHFTGSLKLAGKRDKLQVEAFQIETQALNGLSLQANGMVGGSATSPQIDLQLISTAGNPSAWASLFGLSLPRLKSLSLKGRYSGHMDDHKFEGETYLGNTQFRTLAHGFLNQQRPRMDVKLSASSVHLEDFGLFPQSQTNETAPHPDSEADKDGQVFDATPLPLDKLLAFDLLLMVRADKILGKDVALQEFGFDVKLENGRLQIGPSSLSYRDGSLSIETILDTATAVPKMTVKMTAEDIDIDEVLSYLHEPIILEGQLNLVIDLYGSGTSAKEIAASLSGEIGVAVENGKIQRGIELLASDALDFLFTAPRKKSYTDLNCMAARLLFENGIGTIQTLYMDTPAVRAQGAGSMNLASETVDMVIRPTAKRRLLKRSSPIRIHGPLGDPSITKIPAQEAATLAAQIMVPIVALSARALGYLWSLIRNDKDENSPCLTATP